MQRADGLSAALDKGFLNIDKFLICLFVFSELAVFLPGNRFFLFKYIFQDSFL